MSILDQRRLIESIHPFDLLSSSAMDSLMGKIDIAYYAKDTLLISKDISSIAFYIIIKGNVVEYLNDEIQNVYSEGDSFDSDALIYGTTKSKFVVTEDVVCYEIKKEDFLELLQDKRVQSYFLDDFVSRHQKLKQHHSANELTQFLMARVSDIYLHEVCLVNANTTIYDALQKQSQLQSNVIIVKDDNKYKIVTDSDLRNRVLLQRMDLNQPIVEIASSGLISIDYNDFLFNALLMMTHNEIKRIVVTKEGKIVGVLEQIDLLSYFANHSHLIAVQIDKANSIEDLKYIQNDLGHLITSLKSRGVKVRYIAKLISTLNVKMYKKMFQISVDPSLQDKCALIVMGSEGRGEQIFKTDQDNALIIADGVDKELFTQPMMQLNEHLLALGFPRCKGDVMVSNPFWRRSVNEFKMFVKELCSSLNENDLQNLSILLDAKAVAGKLEFVDELKRYMYENFHARDDVLAHMAKAVLNFETPLSVFSSFVLEKKHDGKLDIKKGGLFALVHGIRTLALQYEIDAINSLERIKELNNKGVIDKNFAMELIESFDTLSTIRLEAMDTLSHDNYIDPKTLQKNQRDLLKDSFKIVNKFKKFMNFHFHLDMVV